MHGSLASVKAPRRKAATSNFIHDCKFSTNLLIVEAKIEKSKFLVHCYILYVCIYTGMYIDSLANSLKGEKLSAKTSSSSLRF